MRPADKGGGVTVERHACVEAEANKEMDKADTYRNLESSRIRNTERVVRVKLTEMEDGSSISKAHGDATKKFKAGSDEAQSKDA